MGKIIKISLITLFLILNTHTLRAQEMNTQQIEIIQKQNFQSAQGSENYFTGNVFVDSMLPNNHESNISLAEVSFKEGARTAWHTHPKGQILIITNGLGIVQKWGEKEQQITKGDVVWFPANIKHWHGATPNSSMKHISIVVLDEGKSADWLEQVTTK